MIAADIEAQKSFSDLKLDDSCDHNSSQETSKKNKKKKSKKKKAPQVDSYYERALEGYPVSLRSTKTKGRHAVAMGDINEGTTVCLERATGFVVRSNYVDQQCHVCLQTLSTKLMCSDCKKAYYCSQRCLERDDLHTLACSTLAQVAAIGSSTDTDPDLLSLMTLLLTRRARENQNKPNTTDTLAPTPFWCVNDLISHREKATPDFIRVLTEASQRLLSEMPDSMHLPVEDLVTLACRINANAHGLGDDQSRNTDVALGLFPVGAMFFNHACNPNCSFVGLSDGQLAFRTIRPVKNEEELTVSYIDLYAPRDERRIDLLQSKHFWCKCKRCTTPMKASVDRLLQGVVCTECKKDVYVIPPASMEELVKGQKREESHWQCAGCEHIASPETIRQILEQAQSTYATGMTAIRRERNYRRARQKLEPLAKLTTGNLHPQNAVRLNACIPLMNCMRHENDLKGAIDINRSIINLLEEHAKQQLPRNTAEISDFWQNLGELCNAMADQHQAASQTPLEKKWRKDARHAFAQAARVRSVVYGPDHPKTKLAAKHVL
ncbi:hypothetical protein DFQ28_001000 [Apophysomyces sp. BC1034]|nr:hypothetical protein DFQ30_001552 [Apophysomyces sp. BC1015]KAG0167047.1 hypothetical protein DFQ29_000668 [Apophysomyces sp. BC1021]KAG0183778.1 hypothetical protein DFQ28_001000 [Apophysomyces sp. BC1034]